MPQPKKFLIILLSIFSMLIFSAHAADFKDLKGNDIALSKLKGKWVVVNVWASWCENCLEEIPALNKFAKDHPEVALYGVNYDQITGASLAELVQKLNIRFSVLTENPGSSWGMPDTDVIPATYIINPEGKVVKTLLGENDENSLWTTLQELQKSK